MAAINQGPDSSDPYGRDMAGRLGRGLEAIVEWAGRITMALVLAMVLLIATNVILRYLFAIGPVSLQELEWHLMAPIAMIGSAYTLRHHGHVRVDIVFARLGPRLQALVNLLAAAGLLVTSILVVKLSLGFVYQAYEIGEGSPDPGGLPYRFLLKAVIPIGFTLIALQAAAHMILYGKRLLGR